MSSSRDRPLREWYEALLAAYGPQGWWPGDNRTEVILGAILTQNTNWRNVEKALVQLRQAGLIDWQALREVPVARLAELIRPAGYFNVKAQRLKNFVDWLWRRYEGRLEALLAVPLDRLREALLEVKGIGPETADSILLYALARPSFVVDAYTRRLAVRHGLAAKDDADYEKLKAIFEAELPRETALFNEYHALIVAVGKRHCGPSARCEGCPLSGFPHDAEAF